MQGFSVDVFERRPEPKDDSVDLGRAYIIILIPRGQVRHLSRFVCIDL